MKPFIALTAAGLFAALAAAPAHAEREWGALALSERSTAYGYAKDFDTQEAASARADAEVDVLHVGEVVRLQAADRLEHLAPHEHDAAGHVVDLGLALPLRAVGPPVADERGQVLAVRQQAARRPQAPAVRREQDARADDSLARVRLQRAGQEHLAE